MKEEKMNQLTSSRKVIIRDINAALFAPISRIKTLRDDEGLSSNVGQALSDNKGMASNLNTPRTPVLTHSTLSLQGEGDETFAPSPLRGKVHEVGMRGERENKYSSSPLRERMPAGQVRGKSAFTLIEMLVGVLIIAILAAIALPQYQKAVAKARMMELIVQARTLRQALIMYQLTNGSTATSLSNLDIWDKNGKDTLESKYLGKNQYINIGGYYIQVSLAIPGYKKPLCWFNWKGTKGFCRMYNERGAALAESLGWEVCVAGKTNIYPYCNENDKSYHIGWNWNR